MAIGAAGGMAHGVVKSEANDFVQVAGIEHAEVGAEGGGAFDVEQLTRCIDDSGQVPERDELAVCPVRRRRVGARCGHEIAVEINADGAEAGSPKKRADYIVDWSGLMRTNGVVPDDSLAGDGV